MCSYHLTVFNQAGEKMLDESFSAANDEEAKRLGLAQLNAKNMSDFTYRCVSPDAKLLLFHR